MIIKIFNPNTYGYAVQANVDRYAYKYIRARCPNACKDSEGCESCPDPMAIRDISLLSQDMTTKTRLSCLPDTSLSVVEIWMQSLNGEEHVMYAEVMNTYIMNDSGKTIEHF
jgi:hypothetical protein